MVLANSLSTTAEVSQHHEIATSLVLFRSPMYRQTRKWQQLLRAPGHSPFITFLLAIILRENSRRE